MDPFNNESADNSSLSPSDSEANKSFVKKVTSRVSGLLPSSISKWFGAREDGVRPRDLLDDDDEEEFLRIQPPAKKQKLPERNEGNHSGQASTSAHIFKYNHCRNNELSYGHFGLAGPSNCGKRLNNVIETDTGSNTSGYSSLAKHDNSSPVKEQGATDKVEKQVGNNHLFNSISTPNKPNERTLFSQGISSPSGNTSLSSRRPSFNASTFGSSTSLNQTLSSKAIMSSPFYKGRTTYGGASAYSSHNYFKSAAGDKSRNNSVQITPSSTTNDHKASLSKTARRILETLEHYTTPAAEIKKIPHPTARKSSLHPYSKPTNQELQVPTVPDLLKMKLKERLQDSTVSVRRLANSSNSELNKREYAIKTVHDAPAKHVNKIKTKVSSSRAATSSHNLNLSETVQEVQLPNIQLPISTLPKFDFNIPTPNAAVKTSNSSSSSKSSANSKSPGAKENKDKGKEKVKILNVVPIVQQEQQQQFKFSPPIVIATNVEHVKAVNNFKFSEPVSKKQKALKPAKEKKKHNGEHSALIAQKEPAKSEQSLAERFKPAEGVWECSVCLIRNKPDADRCAACETKKPGGDLSKFKLNSEQWECPTCLVRNKNTDSNCAACTNPKPAAKVANGAVFHSHPAPTPPTVSLNSSAPIGFQNLYKAPTNTWECSVCLIRNKDSLNKCAACETPKQQKIITLEMATFGEAFVPKAKEGKNGFGAAFEKKEGEWECGSCMVRNSATNSACVCCETPRPGSGGKQVLKLNCEPNKITSTFNFGVEKNKFTFGIKPAENKSVGNAAGFQFGSSNKDSAQEAPPKGFTFGIPATVSSEDVDVAKKSDTENKASLKPTKPEDVKTSEPNETPKFTFGVPKSAPLADTTKNSLLPTTPAPQFKFGAVNGTSDKAVAVEKPANIKDKSKDPPTTTFKFGSQAAPLATLQFNPEKRPLGDAEAPPTKKTDLEPTLSKPSFFDSSNKQQQQQQFGSSAKQNFTFGSNSNPPTAGVSNNQPNSLFNLNANNNKKPPEGSLFSANKAPDVKQQTNIFASASSSNSSNMFAPPAGQSSANPPPKEAPPTATFSFNSAATSKQENSSPSLFAFAAKTDSAPSTTFSFNNASSSETGGTSFKFGHDSAPKSSSLFNPPPVQQQQQHQQHNSQQQQQNLFDVNQSAGAVKSGAFNFASPSTAPVKAGFSFGSPAPSNIFAFGTSNSSNQPQPQPLPSLQPPGGYNFGNSVPQFNANVRPTFNFTGGSTVPVFSATGTPTEKPHRVMRKALRRTQR